MCGREFRREGLLLSGPRRCCGIMKGEFQIDLDSAVFGDNDYGDALETLACPTASLCVAADGDGNVLSTTDPTQERPWKSERQIGPGTAAYAYIVCTSTTLCLLIDGSSVHIFQDPTGNASTPCLSG